MESIDTQDTEIRKRSTVRVLQLSNKHFYLKFLVGIILGLLIVTTVYMAARKITTTAGTGCSRHPLMERFPGYFRSPSEQYYIEANIGNFVKITKKHKGIEGDYNLRWSKNSSNVTPKSGVYHACCHSRPGYSSPRWMVDMYGVNRTLATFQVGNLIYRQYFYTEWCRQWRRCTFCTCALLGVCYTGVYFHNGEYGISWFKFHGSCKCLNI